MSDAEERSIEDDVRLAMEGMSEGVVIDNATGAVVDDAPVVEEVKDGPSRDATGKFAAKEPIEEVAPVEGAEAPALVAEPDDKPVTPDPHGLAPVTWTAASKEKWNEIPADLRAEITKREKDVHQLATRFDGERQFGKQVKDVIAPYEGFIKSLGAEPVQAVDYLIKTDYVLRTAPVEQRKALFIKAAKDYGIDLASELGAMPNEALALDPAIETLQQRIQRLEVEQNAAISLRQETEEQDIQSRIEAFAADPANVYFDRVSPLMGAFLSSGQATDLAQAYDMAVYADPETRALHLTATSAEQERKRTQDAAAKAAAARNASVSVTGAPGLAVPAQASNAAASLEDDIRSAISATLGRA